mmetsp:Transcript_21044/g.40249  ORF Transcript_21044/g.40249 Transcript_21044/m.40249 type:complete len:226 (+) Transcript_21044:563-1240(+)
MFRVPAMEPPHHAVGKSRADVAQLHEHAQEVDIRHRHRAIQEVTDQRNTGTSLVDDADDGALERDVRDQSSFNEVIDNLERPCPDGLSGVIAAFPQRLDLVLCQDVYLREIVEVVQDLVCITIKPFHEDDLQGCAGIAADGREDLFVLGDKRVQEQGEFGSGLHHVVDAICPKVPPPTHTEGGVEGKEEGCNRIQLLRQGAVVNLRSLEVALVMPAISSNEQKKS